MSYTVKQLAKISGISSRTLRFYDEIGLLKPARYGDNTYRYYEEEQLLLLQQILFFRELGFPLNDIQGFMSNPGFDKIKTLGEHRISLQRSLEKTEALIKTIDKTVSHLKGEKKMNATNLYEGFHSKIEKAVEDFTSEMQQSYVDNGMSKEDMDIMEKAGERVKTWSPGEFAKHMVTGDELLKEFVLAIEKNHAPDSLETQALVSRHYNWSSLMSGAISKKGYCMAFAQSGDSPQVSDHYNKYHPELMVYLFSAMKVFSEVEVN